ncbi:MAG: hypothetical protein ACPGN3_09455, partial [Opitutales bacterium]
PDIVSDCRILSIFLRSGIITCSAFGEEAQDFFGTASKLLEADPDPLVKARAAEFLGLTRQSDPMSHFTAILNSINDPVEANIILNSVVLLRDSGFGYNFDISSVSSAPWNQGKSNASRRFQYLSK